MEVTILKRTQAYADWDFYTSEYLGIAIAEEAAFRRLALRASGYVDRLTMGRARNAAARDAAPIRMATCAAAEALQAEDALRGGPQVTQERLDNYSIHYEAVSAAEQQRRVRSAASLYLLPTGLLYAGLGGA